MTHDGDPTMTTEELIATLAQVGCHVTSEQLKRWSRAGALSRPTQLHRLGHRGSETVWPAAISDQVAAVADYVHRLRSLDAALMATWWDDWPVDTNALLTVLANGIKAHPIWTIDRSGDEEERLDSLDETVRSADSSRVRGPIAKALRRVGRSEEDRRSFLFAIGSIASGIALTPEGLDVGLNESSLEEILTNGLALDRFAAQLDEFGDAVTTSDLVRDVVDISWVLESMAAHALEVVAAANVAELSTARDQAKVIMFLPELAAAILPIAPANGLGLLGEQIPTDGPGDWLLLLVITLWFRSERSEGLSSIVSALTDVVAKTRAFRAVREAVPEFDEIVNLAAGDQAILARLMDGRPGVRASMNQFLQANPEIRTVLEE